MSGTPSFRVCHIVSGDGWGGLEAMVAGLLEGQSASPEYEVSVIVLNQGRLERQARELGIRVVLIPESKVTTWKLLRQLSQALRELRPDIIHTHRYKEILFASLLAPRLGLRHVVTLHGSETPTSRLARYKERLRDFIWFNLARRAGTLFAAVSRDLQRNYRVPDDRCMIIPNGIPVTSSGAIAAHDAHPRNGPPLIGWAGRMVPIKSVQTLLEALALMSNRAPKPRLLLLGDGPERAALTEQARQLGIQDQVDFEGFVDNIPSYYARMSVFALPSLHEGVPLVLLEAMRAGVPVVAAGVGGIPEMIGSSGAAQLVYSRAPAEWAQALSRLIDHPAEAIEMVARGRELLTGRFSLEAMRERYAALYRQSLARTNQSATR